MDTSDATKLFAALSSPIRLNICRLLIKVGEGGMLSGELSTALDIPPNTASNNLVVLSAAGLVQNERQGRAVRYFADFQTIKALLSFLMEDCCGGKPQKCRPIIEEITCAC